MSWFFHIIFISILFIAFHHKTTDENIKSAKKHWIVGFCSFGKMIFLFYRYVKQIEQDRSDNDVDYKKKMTNSNPRNQTNM